MYIIMNDFEEIFFLLILKVMKSKTNGFDVESKLLAIHCEKYRSTKIIVIDIILN